MTSHGHEPKSKKGMPIISWTMAAVLVGIVGFEVLSSGRHEANLKALCAQYYASARTAADTVRVDRRIVEMVGKYGTTCLQYRAR